MVNYSYTKSQVLIENLARIDQLRSQLLSIPLPRTQELQFRWETTIERMYYSLSLYDLSINKRAVEKSVSLSEDLPATVVQKEIRKFKKAFDLINYNWYMKAKNVLADDLEEIYRSIWKVRGTLALTDLDEHMRYIQSAGVHPVIQAALAHSSIYNLQPFPLHNNFFSHIGLYMMLIKNGWDLRGFVTVENSFFHERVYYKNIIQESYNQNDLTPWLEYFSEAFAAQLKKVIETISVKQSELSVDIDFFELNDRQKNILSLLDQPGAVITNKKVQKLGKISAITASRDLTKLVELGLIFPKGKGRSTSYSKV